MSLACTSDSSLLSALEPDALRRRHVERDADVHLAVRRIGCCPNMYRPHSISICRGRRQTLGLFPGEHNFNRFPAWLVRALAMQLDLLSHDSWLSSRTGQEFFRRQAAPHRGGGPGAHTGVRRLLREQVRCAMCQLRDILALSNGAHAGLPFGRSTCQHCGSPSRRPCSAPPRAGAKRRASLP